MKKNFTQFFFGAIALSLFLSSCKAYDSQSGHQERIDRHHELNQVR